MVGHERSRVPFAGLGLVGLLLLAGLASLAFTPTHRSTVRISDPGDPGLPPEFDAILLEGFLDGGTYVVTLSLRGTAQARGYQVFILGRESGRSDGPHVYRLDYMFGREESYGVGTERNENRLIFHFPIDLLIDGAYIVGLEARTDAFEGSDYVRESPRENLTVPRLLEVPFDPALMVLATVALAVGLVGLLVRTSLRGRRPGPPL